MNGRRAHLKPRSLRQKLPLLVATLAAGTLAIAISLAYVEVRRAARTAAEARLESVALQLVDLIETGRQSREVQIEELGRSPQVRAALAGAAFDSAQLVEALDDLRTGTDADLPVALFDRSGEVVFAIGTPPAGADPQPEPPLDSVARDGVFRQVGEQILYWHSSPLPPDEPRGWLAQRRRIGNPQTEGVIETLVGSGVDITVGHRGDSVWVGLGGARIESGPDQLTFDETFAYQRPGGVGMLAAASALPESDWVLLVQMPSAQVLERPLVFLRRALIAGLLLLLLTVAIAWRASRRLTEPLEGLSEAADRIARGDYGRRVRAEGDDEVARLARAFDQMAEQVARSDEALRERLEEARALAVRLEEANVQAESAREAAQEASRAKSEFLATMSHEVRTPINAVIGYTALLESGIPDPPTDQQREYLRRIDRSSRLLMSLVNDVLDLSRIESGRLSLETTVGSAEEAILAAVAALEPEANAKGVALERRCAEGHGFRGDPQRVQQILLNLLSNAVKFTPSGGRILVTCGVAEDEDDSTLRIDVEDTGIGIREDQLVRVFEPFVQGHVGFTREHGGAGLGLSISRRLARMMSGDLTVESTFGEGSRFTLRLPAAAVDAGATVR